MNLQIQYEGMRLFLIWYQILQDAAGDDCHEVFASLVPRLGGRDDAEYLGVKEAEISTSGIDVFSVFSSYIKSIYIYF